MKVADLFCGCGGFSLGFDYLSEDFELVYALDNWDVACKSYEANFPYVDVDCRDALTVKPQEIPKVDVIIGGPPCQEFSVAKHNKNLDMSLVHWFLSVIEYQKPQFWIMENVPLVKTFLKGNFQKKIYRMHEYGIPQVRKRVFAGNYYEPKKAVCEIIFPTVCASEYRGPSSWKSWSPYYMNRLSTVLRRRALMHECMVVQTFPLDFILRGKIKDKLIQIGNAVPPLMSYRFAEALVNPQQKLLEESEGAKQQ